MDNNETEAPAMVPMDNSTTMNETTVPTMAPMNGTDVTENEPNTTTSTPLA
jgi:hypothetical protein